MKVTVVVGCRGAQHSSPPTTTTTTTPWDDLWLSNTSGIIGFIGVEVKHWDGVEEFLLNAVKW